MDRCNFLTISVMKHIYLQLLYNDFHPNSHILMCHYMVLLSPRSHSEFWFPRRQFYCQNSRATHHTHSKLQLVAWILDSNKNHITIIKKKKDKNWKKKTNYLIVFFFVRPFIFNKLKNWSIIFLPRKLDHIFFKNACINFWYATISALSLLFFLYFFSFINFGLHDIENN